MHQHSAAHDCDPPITATPATHERVVYRPLLALAIMLVTLATGCRNRSVEVIDLNKVLDIYDKVVKSKEDAEKTESSRLEAASGENEKDTQEFLVKFADQLNQAKLIRSPIGVEILGSGMIQGFHDRNRDRKRTSGDAVIFTIELDTVGNRIIATQKVGTQTYRRDHHYSSSYHRYYYFHRMHGSMWYRQNHYYSSPGRRRPVYSGLPMSKPTYHSSAVTLARSTSRSSFSSGSSSSARGFSSSRSFSSGK